MNRRDLLRYSTTFVLTGGAAFIASCRRGKQVARNDPPPPTPEPTASAEITPEGSPTPFGEPSAPAPSGPAAPYGELTQGQQSRVDSVMESLGEVNANEAKRWHENLAFDEVGAEKELQVWEAIADAYRKWNEERPGINESAKQEAFNAILTGSLLPVDEALRYVKLTALTQEDARAAILLYDTPASAEAVPSEEVPASPSPETEESSDAPPSDDPQGAP